ncbi:MAG: hypothetical protein AB9880_00685 [Christensenellales bacterium]
MRRLALLCFENPFVPPAVGGKIATISHIRSLLMCGFSVDVYIPNDKDVSSSELHSAVSNQLATVFQFRMKLSPFAPFSGYPISVSRRYVKECADQLKLNRYDVAFYEGEHMMKYRIRNDVNAKKHILYMHDIESNYRNELSRAQSNILSRVIQKGKHIVFFA